MKHLEDLFSVLPTFVLRWLLGALLTLRMGQEIRIAIFCELRFREQLDEEVATARREAYGRSITYGRSVRGQA